MSWSVNMGGHSDTQEGEAEVVKVLKELEAAGHVLWSTVTTAFHGSGDVHGLSDPVASAPSGSDMAESEFKPATEGTQ